MILGYGHGERLTSNSPVRRFDREIKSRLSSYHDGNAQRDAPRTPELLKQRLRTQAVSIGRMRVAVKGGEQRPRSPEYEAFESYCRLVSRKTHARLCRRCPSPCCASPYSWACSPCRNPGR